MSHWGTTESQAGTEQGAKWSRAEKRIFQTLWSRWRNCGVPGRAMLAAQRVQADLERAPVRPSERWHNVAQQRQDYRGSFGTLCLASWEPLARERPLCASVLLSVNGGRRAGSTSEGSVENKGGHLLKKHLRDNGTQRCQRTLFTSDVGGIRYLCFRQPHQEDSAPITCSTDICWTP